MLWDGAAGAAGAAVLGHLQRALTGPQLEVV